MVVFNLIRAESELLRRKWLVLLAVAGLSNALILAVINKAAELTRDTEDSFPFFVRDAAEQVTSSGDGSFRYLVLFILFLVAYVWSQRYVLVTSTTDINKILHRLQLRLVEKIRRCELQGLESIGKAKIFTTSSRDVQSISQTAPMMVFALQSAVLILFTVIYIAFLSLMAVVVCAVFTGIAIVYHMRNLKEIVADMQEVSQRETKLFDTVSHFLDGFKEVKMHARRSDDLLGAYNDLSSNVRDLRISTYHKITRHLIFSQVTFYILMALMVFVVPRFSEGYSNEDVIKGTAAVLFLIGPISGLVNAMPSFTNANVAAVNLMTLEAELDQTAVHESYRGRKPRDFKEIGLEGVTFTFEDPRAAHPFTVGPLDLTIPKGELLFISGGNGTGKSTLLKLLTALFFPQKGAIRIDSTPLSRVNTQAYRDLIAFME